MKRDPATALLARGRRDLEHLAGTLKAMGEMIIGARGTDELGGPIRIAQMSGEVRQRRLVALIGFMAVLSVNLGLINLFPDPRP